jgi:hypothetical protein
MYANMSVPYCAKEFLNGLLAKAAKTYGPLDLLTPAEAVLNLNPFDRISRVTLVTSALAKLG